MASAAIPLYLKSECLPSEVCHWSTDRLSDEAVRAIHTCRKHGQAAAQSAWRPGAYLSLLHARLIKGRKWATWLRQQEEIVSEHTARRHILLYERTGGRATDLDEMTLTEAYAAFGITRFTEIASSNESEPDHRSLPSSGVIQPDRQDSQDGRVQPATGASPGETGNLGISGHEPHYRGRTEEWLTPRFILDALGPFDLDPCAPMNRPWDTARRHFTVAQGGLSRRWTGGVWLNPPYGPQTHLWLKQMAMHANGIVLTFARTDTAWFSESVWGSASALYFLRGRVRFCTPDGEPSEGTGGAPSVLIAYDPPGTYRNRAALRTCGLDGYFAPLLHPSSKCSTEYETLMGDEDAILRAAAAIRQRRVAERLKEIQERRQQSRPVRMKKRGGPVLHGDCLDLIPTLEDKSVSLVVTSPPYSQQRSGHYEGVSEEDYPDFTVNWMSALAPKMTPDGSVFIVIRPHVRDGVLSDYLLKTRLAVREAGWHECEELIWLKPDAPPLGSKLRSRRAWESILWFSRCAQPFADLKACGKESDRLGFNGAIKFAEGGVSEKTAWHPCVESFGKGNGVARITDVIVANVGGNEPGLDHPAVFPLALAEHLIKTFSQAGDLVLDNFCGSGQTLLAAKGCGRRYLGIEREAKYVRIALGRLR